MSILSDGPADGMILKVAGLTCGYGKTIALKGINFSAREAEIVGIVGPNGAGKTTLLEAIAGTLPIGHGSVEFRGQRIDRWRVLARRKLGLMLIPQEGHIFPLMSVGKNLEVGQVLTRRAEREQLLDYAYELFPDLRGKGQQVANTLSGGQQKMLAVAICLVSNAQVMLIDEPSIGLAPRLVTRMFDTFARIRRDLGKTIVLSEQNIKILDIADRLFGLEAGEVRFDEETRSLSREAVMDLYMGKVG